MQGNRIWGSGEKTLLGDNGFLEYYPDPTQVNPHFVLAGDPSGSAADYAAFRALVPADISSGAGTGLYLTTNGSNFSWTNPIAGGGLISGLTTNRVVYSTSSTTIGTLPLGTLGAILTSQGSGVLTWTSVNPVANGGTGQSTALFQGGVIYGSSTSVMGCTPCGVNPDQVFVSSGTAAPSFVDAADIPTIAELITGAATGEAEIIALGVRLATAETNIGINTADIASINIDIASMATTLTTLNGDVVTINASIAAIDTNLTTLNGDVVTINASLAAIDGEITVIDATLGTQGAAITTLQGEVATNTAAIITINGAIGGLDAALATTDATAAALAITVTALGVTATAQGISISSLQGTVNAGLIQGQAKYSVLGAWDIGAFPQPSYAQLIPAAIPNIDLSLAGTSGQLGGKVFNNLTLGNGGTGNNITVNPGGVIFGSSSTTMDCTAAGTTGQALISQGSSAPAWTTIGGTISGLTTGKIPIATSASTLADSILSVSGSSNVATYLAGTAGWNMQVQLIPSDATPGGHAAFTRYFSDNTLTNEFDVGVDGIGYSHTHDGQALFQVAGTVTDYWWRSGANNVMHLTAAGALTPTTLTPTNPVGTAYGGTGQTGALTTGGIIWGASTSAMGCSAAGTSGQFLKSNGASAPTWATPSGLITGLTSGTFPIANSSTTIADSLFTYSSPADSNYLYGAVTNGNILSIYTPVTSGKGAMQKFSNSAATASMYMGLDSATLLNVSAGNGVFSVKGTATDFYWQSGLTTVAHLDGSGNFTPTTLTPTNPVGTAYGGTGQTGALVAGGVIWATSTTAMACSALGTTGQFLKSNGASAPTWATPSGLITGLTSGTFPIATSATTIGNSSFTFDGSNIYTFAVSAINTASKLSLQPLTTNYGSFFAAINASGGSAAYFGLDGTGVPGVSNTGQVVIQAAGGATDIYFRNNSTVTAHLDATGNFTAVHLTPSNPVGTAYGGTGQSSALTQYGVVYAATTTSMANTSAGSATQVLTSNGTSAPTFQAIPTQISGLTINTFPIATSSTTIGNSLLSYSSSGGLTTYTHLGNASNNTEILVQPSTAAYSPKLVLANSAATASYDVSIDSTNGYNVVAGQVLYKALGTATDFYWYSATTQVAHLDASGNFTATTLTPSNALSTSHGGTGQSANFVAGGVLYGATTTTLGCTGVGLSGQALVSQVGSPPIWQTISGTISGLTTNTFPIATSSTTIGNSGLTWNGSGEIVWNPSATSVSCRHVILPASSTYSAYSSYFNSAQTSGMHVGMDGGGYVGFANLQGMICMAGATTSINIATTSQIIATFSNSGIALQGTRALSFNGGPNFTYDEGTWTPTLWDLTNNAVVPAGTGGGTNGSFDGTTVTGSWVRSGKQVTLGYVLVGSWYNASSGISVGIGSIPAALACTSNGKSNICASSSDNNANVHDVSNPATTQLWSAGSTAFAISGSTLNGRVATIGNNLTPSVGANATTFILHGTFTYML